MIKPHAKTQQKIVDIINTLKDDADITAPMFYHLCGEHKSTINKSLRKLSLKGYIEFDRTETPLRGGQPMNVYKKCKSELDDFEFGLITEGVFADLFKKPVIHEAPDMLKVRLLTGNEEDEDD